ncbi:MAG: heparinase II/III domain-containing protein [bacterium]
MLTERFPQESLAELITPRSAYRPHPTIDDRPAWTGLAESVKAAHIAAAERLIGYEYPSLPATLFLQYSRNGNRRNYEREHFARRGALETLLVAECIEAKGRFLDDIVNGIWTICEETYWGVPAHIRVQKAGNTLPDAAEPTVDLFAAETGNLIAWGSYLLGERLEAVSPVIPDRIGLEVRRRILDPLYEREDFSWMGFIGRKDQRRVNNWNPWICSNWLSACLLMETDEDRRVETIAKILRTVDNFLDPYPEDGGCDEGPSYWGRAGAALFDNLDLLHNASDGRIDVYDDPKVGEIGRFIYRVHIAEDYYINFADAPALVYPDAALVYHYGEAIRDEAMMQHGRWLAGRQQLAERGYATSAVLRPANLQRLLRGLFSIDAVSRPGRPPLPRDTWLPDIHVMVARDRSGSSDGFFLGAKGGHNNESHNHNDVGNLIVYLDGKPLIVDAGVETYSAKTFGPDRYSIWTMRSSYHTLLPTVDGVEQRAGFEFRATDLAHACEDESARLALDIAPAYPPEAGIEAWRRSVELRRAERVTISDTYRLTGDAGEIAVAIVTPCAVDISRSGAISLAERTTVGDRSSAAGTLAYDPAVLAASVETVPITDERCGATWGTEIYRVVLTARAPAREGTWVYTVTR